MLASVIIPSYNRQEMVVRAYNSVLNQAGSSSVEVILVDDGSLPALIIDNLRSQDKIIRLEKNSGGAVARNAGLDAANGEIIYFLDSDDYFLKRDFIADRIFIGESDNLFYCTSTVNKKIIPSPNYVESTNYFESIFFIYPSVANTCSIVFKNSKNIRFDPSMPKHQDWEFVYSNFISKGINLLKIDGVIAIDRSDRASTSRTRNFQRSLPWLNKLKKSVDQHTFDMAEYHILGDYPDYMNWFNFFRTSVKLLLNRKNTIFVIFKKTVQRILL